MTTDDATASILSWSSSSDKFHSRQDPVYTILSPWKGKSLRKLNDYHIYVSNAFSHYHTMDNKTKMCFIKPVLRDTIMIQLEERGALPSCFDHANDDPFYLAPFTTEDFRSDLKKVVNYHWHKLSEEKMSARKSCAVALNSRQYIVNLALYNNAC